MIDSGSDALEQALALHATPEKLPQLRERPLPEAVLLLIRIAAGDRQAIQGAATRTKVGTKLLTDAAVLYIQQVLFDADADNYRLLGVRADASEASFREHYRWLMRWLHPDRHADRLGVVYSQRVNLAWHALRSSERRHAYDQQQALDVALPAQKSASSLRRPPGPTMRVPPQPTISSRFARNLPMFVLGGLATIAIGLLGFLYWLDQIDEPHVPALRASVRPDDRIGVGIVLQPRTSSGLRTAAAGAEGEKKRVQSMGNPLPVQVAQSAAAPSDGTTQNGIHVDQNYLQVPDRLVNAYAQGDLARMMQLFGPDAADDRGGIATITAEYERLFRETRSRQLRLSGMTWSEQGGRIVGAGAFDAQMRRPGRLLYRRMHGRVRIEVARIDGEWKVQRMSLREDVR
jgi:hypothetical protein